MSTPATHRSLVTVFLTLGAMAFAGTIALAMSLRGWSFYGLSVDARVDHPDFRQLSPSGGIGLLYGQIGAALIFLNLLYLVRRRLAALPLGPMRFWLDAHVLTGLLSGTFVAFHSAFQLRTPLATLTVISLSLVIATGLIGRFLYALAPKPDPVRFERMIAAIERDVPGLGTWIKQEVNRIAPTRLGPETTLLKSLAYLWHWRGQAIARRDAIDAALLGWTELLAKPQETQTKVRAQCRKAAKLAWRDVRAVAASTVLDSWRSVHRLMALLLILSVVFHIGVALYYGYGLGLD